MDMGIFDVAHSMQATDIICGYSYKYSDIYITRNSLKNLNYRVGEMKLRFNIYFDINWKLMLKLK